MKSFSKGLAVMAAVSLALSGTACTMLDTLKTEPAPQSDGKAPVEVAVSMEPVEIVQAKLPPPAVKANFAVTLATNQYLQARLLTEAVTTADFGRDDVKELSKTLDNALAAWEDAETLAEEAADLTDVVAEELEESGDSKRGSSRRDSDDRDKDTKDWTAPFSRPFDPVDIMLAQEDLMADVLYDADEVADSLEDLAAILGSQSSLSGADLRDAEDLADEINDLPVVGLQVASTGLPSGGSIGELPGSNVRGRMSDKVILTGVDAVAMVGARSSSLFVGANNQVVIEEETLPTDADEITAVLGIVELTPDLKKDVVKEPPNVVVPVSASPTRWVLTNRVLSIQIQNVTVEPVLILAEIPLDTEQGIEDALEDLGVPTFDPPDMTPDELADDFWVNPEEVIQVVDKIWDDVQPEAEEEAPEKQEPKETPKKETPQETPKEEAPAPSGLNVAGTYEWSIMWDVSDGDIGFGDVTLSGNRMTVQVGGTTYSGNYNASSQTFVSDSGGSQTLTLTFTSAYGGVSAEGLLDDGFHALVVMMAKVS